MRIITEKRLKSFADRHSHVKPGIERFVTALRAARWKNMNAMRKEFPHADIVRVKSGRAVFVFNIGGNQCRIAAAPHFNKQIIYILGAFTHAEYQAGKWKEQL